MPMTAAEIQELLRRHLQEASGGLRDCSVSELTRGQCTSRNYFIFKIDLAHSTVILKRQNAAGYARVAHPYLSTIDKITQQWGAEPEQTEYQGDGVLAFFPERGGSAENVLSAAVQAHYAVKALRQLAAVNLIPRVLLHYAPLTVAKIGPYNESHRVALGLPIHFVANKEESVAADEIWLSDEMAAQLDRSVRLQYVTRRNVEKTTMKQVEVPAAPPPAPTLFNALSGSYGRCAIPTASTPLGEALAPSSAKAYHELASLLGAAQPRFETRPVTERVADGHTVKLSVAYAALNLPLSALAS